MLKRLDKYILKKFLVTFFFVVIILISIIVIIDITEKIGDFNKMDQTVWQIFTKYYLNFIPYWANSLSPILIFIATVFVTARLATHTEIIAILSSGVSFKRMLVPYLLGSSLIAVLTFYLIGWVIPKANRVRLKFENTHIKDKFYFTDRNVHLKIAPNTFAYIESYDNTSHVGYKFTLENISGFEYDGKKQQKKLNSKVECRRILWDKDRKKWVMENYKITEFNQGDSLNYKITYGQSLDTLMNLKPSDFESKYMFNEQLTSDQLEAYIAELKQRGVGKLETYLVERYERMAYPFAVIILTVIGVIVSSRKTREGAGLQIAVGFGLAFIYVMLIMVSRSIGKNGELPPLVAAWMPNILFALIGLFMYKRVPK
ncbi:LptF/LptG family permease [uncultured Microscilla sp.]|uniref:LptF/LptG family permease n=1 Tax=uncultured Microscilla sp. TaxID=432653 RepID=UPI002603558F|nr:LptF/LptG family permease [uncultured Microscilla sp.]